MQEWQAITTGAAVAVAVASLLVLVGQRTRRDAEIVFAVVSGSMALSLMSPWMDGAPAWMRWAVAIGGSATCNGFWLVSRALFRGDGGVSRVHVLVAGGVALLIAAYRGGTLGTHGAVSPWVAGVESLLTLASSTLLALTFLEALRGGWSSLPRAERRLRVAFMLLFATCVLTVTLLGALAAAWPWLASVRAGVIPLCAMAMILFTHAALWHRRRVPVATVASQPTPRATPGPLSDEDARLARALQRQLDTLQVYREPELKVADLAHRLGTAEHRLSRLITQGLGEKNFNQMINRHRIAYACARLADADDDATILDISGDAGFASLGPFNRAFKAATGCTPTAYRAAHRTTPGAVDMLQTDARS